MAKTFGRELDDVWFEELDPVLKLLMYESWRKDQEEENEFARSYAILQGSFANPEMAKKMIKAENPEFESSDEDFEKVSNQMLENNKQEDSKTIKKRKRRRVIDG